MNSEPNPNSMNDVLVERANEQFARVYEQIERADEQLARVTEQLSKIESDATRAPSVGPGPQAPRRNQALRGLIGLLLGACFVAIVAALVPQSFDTGVKLIVARWAPQLVSTSSSLTPENQPLPTQSGPSPVQVTAAEAAPPQAAKLAQSGSQDAAPMTAAAASELTRLLQAMARDLANLEERIEQLKAKQDQMASDNSRAIEQLKAKQEEMTRLLAKGSEQGAVPKTSPSLALPTQSRQARTRPRAAHPWQYRPYWQYYEEW